MRIGIGKTAGFRSKKNTTRVVRSRAGAIRACYEDQLQVKPKLRGKLVVRWRIELDGRVGTASNVSSSVGNAKVESCVLRVIRRMLLQKPDGGVCVVQWPFTFKAG